MNLAVIGSRSFNDYALLKDNLDNISFDKIVSGGAKGADSLAKKYAEDNSIDIIEHLPDYGKYGRGAPLKRNDLIVKDCDTLIAFWDNKSRGTKYTIDKAKKQNKQVIVVGF